MTGDSYIMANAWSAIRALRLVLEQRKYLVTFLIIGVLFFIGYGYLLLPSSINLAGPKIAIGLNAYSLIVAASMGILFALSVVMSAFAFKRNGASTGKLGIGAVVAAIIPGSLCCTTLIPSMLAVLGASTSTIINTTGALQGPFAAYETPLIVISIGFLLLSVILTSRSIAKCCVVKK